MQNYRNNAMPYNNGYNSNHNANYRCATTQPVAKSEAFFDDDMVLAMAYVRWQKWQKIYDVEKALHYGTLFQELNLPFCGVGGCQK